MNKEDIIRMAREAGLRVGTNLSGVVLVGSPAEIGLAHLTIEELERFAALVAAAEREACAKVCDGMDHNGVMIAADCAAAIRARGNT
tara:strand:+ start:145 stop:405 length:261 start_codon:yes stop_codon:yes gene_type:complete